MALLEKIKKANLNERVEIISSIYQKNREFFSENYPDIDYLIENVTCPYHFDITETFLEIISDESNQPICNINFEDFIEGQSRTSGSNWKDLVNFRPTRVKDSPIHFGIVDQFTKEMNNTYPDLGDILREGKARISTNGALESCLPPTVFLGVFYGLHIEEILSKNKVHKILLIEPNPSVFEVSCYFVDYNKLQDRYGVLPLVIGDRIPSNLLHWFHSTSKITSRLWIRVFETYKTNLNERIIAQIKLQQLILEGGVTSFDKEIKTFFKGKKNIENGGMALSKSIQLSKKSKIAVIASGPSLSNEYKWLKKNQNNLIIIAVLSAVRPLLNQGIIPDFMVSLDTYISDNDIEEMDIDSHIPFLANYKASDTVLAISEYPLLLIEKDNPNYFDFSFALEDTAPSSTNLAVSFALYCNPNELFLIGVDVGYKNTIERFVKGGLHEKNGRIDKDESDSLVTNSNFQREKPIYTNAFLNRVREMIEISISKYQKVKVINFSDGAKINGAIPKHSKKTKITPYKNVDKDIRNINKAFEMLHEGRGFTRFSISENEIVNQLIDSLISYLKVKEFDWSSFSERIDKCVFETFSSIMSQSNCLRLLIFDRLITDVLTQWYRYFLISKEPQIADEIYKLGIEFVENTLSSLKNNFSENLVEKMGFISKYPNILVDLSKDDEKRGELGEALSKIKKAISIDSRNANYYSRLGQLLGAIGDSEGARKAHERAIALGPGLVSSILQLSNLYKDCGEIDRAIAIIRSGIESNEDNAALHAQLGNLFVIKEEKQEAELCYETAVKLNPRAVNRYIQLSNLYKECGEIDRAIATIRAGIESNEDDASIHAQLGNLLVIKEEKQEAEGCYENAIKLNPRVARTYIQLSNLYKDTGEIDHAIIIIRSGIEANKDNAGLHVQLGNLLVIKEEKQEAEICYENAIMFDPQAVHAYIQLSNIYKDRGEIDQAIATIRTGIESNEDNFGLYAQLGNLFVIEEEKQDAEICYETALKLNPQAVHVYIQLSKLYEDSGEIDQAIRIIRSGIEANKDNAGLHAQLGNLLVIKEKTQEAELCYETAFMLNPQAVHAYIQLSNLHKNRGEIDQAITTIRSGIEANKDNASLHAQLGNLLVVREETQEAELCYETAFKLNPQAVHAYIQLSNLYKNRGEIDQAITTIRSGIEANKDNASLHAQLGNLLVVREETQEAELCYETAFKLNPQAVHAYIQLSNLYKNRGEIDQAIRIIRSGIKSNKDNAGLYAQLGNLLVEKEENQEAEVCYETSIKINPRVAHTYIQLSNLYKNRGEIDQAVTLIRSGIEANSDNGLLYSHLGHILLHGNADTAGSKVAYKKAITLNPKMIDSHIHLSNIYKEQGEIDAAIDIVKDAIEFNPDNHILHWRIGYLFQHVGNIEYSMECYKESIKINPSIKDFQTKFNTIFGEYEDIEEAILRVVATVEKNEEKAIIYLQFGSLLYAKGEHIAAIEAYEKAIRLNPKALGIYIMLSNIYKDDGDIKRAINIINTALEIDDNNYFLQSQFEKLHKR